MSNESSGDLLRVVFDTNVYIAAAVSPDRYADEWRKAGSAGRFQLYTSDSILEEAQRKLVDKRIYSEQIAQDLIDDFRQLAKVVRPTEPLKIVRADPDDNKILECAVEARANLIVTMDKHLLRLREFRGIGIAHSSDLKYILKAD